MSKLLIVLRLDLWLFVIPAVVAIALVAAGNDRMIIAGHMIPYLAALWVVLALLWMVKNIFRHLRH